LCGPRCAHEPDRPASRAGTTPSEVVLGGRKVLIQRPRVRTEAGEVALPTFQTMAATDPLDRRVVEQMLVGVATRQYARSLEPLGPEVESRGTSKSAVSRRFVAKTTAQLAAWQSAPLDALDVVALLIDACISAITASSSRWALPRTARNTRWASGTARQRTRPWAQACWRIFSGAA